MQANRSVSRQEHRMRQALLRCGIRGYRLHSRLPVRPDVAFGNGRIAVFIHGCFWHRCPTCDLALPRANREFWSAKFDENVARDTQAQRDLWDLGWQSVVVWEHE